MTTGPTHPSVRTEQLPPADPVQLPRCPQCGSVRAAEERFCESCGHDHTRPATWSVEISVDPSYHARLASGMVLPAGRMAAVLAFEVDEIRIGRRNEAHGLAPDVDLSGELGDPAVSHLHAAIRRDPASALFTIVDLGSTNGTTINDDEQPLEPHQPVALAPGDQIHVGAWTTIRLTV